MNRDEIQTFDPRESYTVVRRQLPHWTQAGTVCFITWRTADSMPREVIQRWIAERNELLRSHGIVVDSAGLSQADAPWRQALDQLPPVLRRELQNSLSERFDLHLDACHGECLLRRAELAKIVGESLLKFNGDRYELTDFVVMPNHVHLLAAFPDEDAMLKQCTLWKRFTGRRINEITRRSGEFWQQEAFDHLVRSVEQFEHYRCYIRNNGSHARLRAGEYLWFSAT